MKKKLRGFLLSAVVAVVCALIFSGLAFGLSAGTTHAATLPDRFDPDRFTSIKFPDLPTPDGQKYYANGYWVVQDFSETSTGGASSTIEMEGFKITFSSSGTKTYNFRLARSGVLNFTYNMDGSTSMSYTLNGEATTLENSAGRVERTLEAGTYTLVFSCTKTTANELALISKLEFGEGPQDGIYRTNQDMWTSENLELIASYDASGGSGSWNDVLIGLYTYKAFPMYISGSAGAYTLTSAEMIDYSYSYSDDANYNLDESSSECPISIIEIPFTLTTSQAISFNYETYTEENYDFFLVFIDGECVLGLSGEYIETFTSSELSAGKHTIMFAVAKDYSVDYWYNDGYAFEAQITNLTITSDVDVSTLTANYKYDGNVKAIANYDVYDVFASSSNNSDGSAYGGVAGTYSDLSGATFANASGYYFKTIYEAASYFNAVATAETTFNMVILDDIELNEEVTFDNTNITTFNIYSDDTDTTRNEYNPYILTNVNGGSILDIENGRCNFGNAKPLKFITGEAYSIKLNESGNYSNKIFYVYGHLMFESSHSDILSKATSFVLTNSGKLQSTNSSGAFTDEYLIDSQNYTGAGAVIIRSSGTKTVTLTNKSFIKIEDGYISQNADGSQVVYTCNGVDHDVYITKERGGSDHIIGDSSVGISRALKVKLSSTALNYYANNYERPIGFRTVDSKEISELFAYYDDQTDTIGKYAFREVYDETDECYYVYLLENVGVTFNYNIPEKDLLGTSNIRESGDTSPITTISVPYGYVITSDSQYSSVSNYDVYGYKKLGWSNNTTINSYTSYTHNTSELLATSEDIQITHAFVGGSGKDNYGYNSANNVTLEDGTVQRYINYYSRWYQFLGDYIEYDDARTENAYEGASVIPIYYADEFVYLSNILKLSTTTAYKGSSTQTFNNSSYAVMQDLEVELYTNYGEDESKGDGAWTYTTTSTINEYKPMCTTSDSAFTGAYFVGASIEYDGHGKKFATELISDGEFAKQSITIKNDLPSVEAEHGGLGGLFGYAGNSSDLPSIKNISLTYDNGSTIRWTDNLFYVGGMVGNLVGSMQNCEVNNVNIDGLGLTEWDDDGATGGVVGNLGVLGQTISGVYMSGIEATNVEIQGTNNINSSGRWIGDVGGVVGQVCDFGAVIENIVVDSAVVCTDTSKNTNQTASFNSVGGVVGWSTGGTYKNITIKGVQVVGHYQVGGVIGGASCATIGDSSIEGNDINVISQGAHITNSYIKGLTKVGGVVGTNTANDTYGRGYIQKCYNEVIVQSTQASTEPSDTGGIVGSAQCDISACTNAGTVSCSGNYVGGIVGTIPNSGNISNCVNSGYINCQRSNYTGGIVGKLVDVSGDGVTCSFESNTNQGVVSGGSIVGGLAGGIEGFSVNYFININNCYNNANVTGSDAGVGGLLGQSKYCTVTNSNSASGATITGKANVGGLVGWAGNTRITSWNYSTVSASSASKVGGIVGYMENTYIGTLDGTTDSWVHNYGAVTGYSDVGGIVGYMTGSSILLHCYNAGNVTGTYKEYGARVGGIAGSVQSGSTTYCYNGFTYEENSYTPTIKGYSFVGGIAGELLSTEGIKNSTNRGKIEDVDSCGGGIVGYAANSTLVDNANKGNVSGSNQIGGIAGYASNFNQGGGVKEILNNSNSGDISGSYYIGGIVGYATSSRLWQCTNYGNIKATSTGNAYCGGIVGRFMGTDLDDDSLMYYCTNSGDITSSGSRVGGIAGSASGTSTFTMVMNYNCVSNVDILGLNGVGGIAGAVSYVSINNSNLESSTGYDSYRIKISGSVNVGGIVGNLLNGATISNCHAKYKYVESGDYGSVYGVYNVGGIVGFSDGGGTISNCSNAIPVSCENSASGTNVGGIVGKSVGSSITSCTNYANITGVIGGAASECPVGGIVGYIENATISSCTNGESTNGIKIAGRWAVGGIAGKTSGVTINKGCINYATIDAFLYTAGGIVGSLTGGSVINSSGGIHHNYGNVTAGWPSANAVGSRTGGDDCGGIVGYTDGNCTISWANNHGLVQGGARVGGIAGKAIDGYFEYCNTYGNVEGTNYVGGGIGWMQSSSLYYCEIGDNSHNVKVTMVNPSINTYAGGVFGYGYDKLASKDYAIRGGSVGVSDVTGSGYLGGIGGYASSFKSVYITTREKVYVYGGFVNVSNYGKSESSSMPVFVNDYDT